MYKQEIEEWIKELHNPIIIEEKSDDYSFDTTIKIAGATITEYGSMGSGCCTLLSIESDIWIYKVSSNIKELSSPPEHDFHSDYDEWQAQEIVTTIHPDIYNYLSISDLFHILSDLYFSHNGVFNDDNVELDDIKIEFKRIENINDVNNCHFVSLF